MEERIRIAIAKALEKLGAKDIPFTVERPGEAAHGDYSTNAALVAGKKMGKDPRELASELARSTQEDLGTSVSRVETAGPGFINITLSNDAIALAIAEADAKGENWGKGETSRERISVEYSNPNPFKEMHIGHLMSNVVGEAISRLVESQGAAVVRDTFGGDVGPHVAKALWGLMRSGATDIATAKEIGEAYAKASTAYETDEAIKKEIDTLNVRIYDVVARAAPLPEDDSALLSLWKKGREVSMQEFRRLFAILGTKLDQEFFDSDTTETGMRVVKDGLAKGVFEKSDGAVIYRGEKKGMHTLVFITSRGTPTYETKDVGLAFIKEERIGANADLIVTAVEQIGHFNVVRAALSELAPKLAEKTRHVPHGLLRLMSGKMSSREGNVITAADFIREVTMRAAQKNPDPLIAERVAVGAIKFMILRQSPGQDIIFDPEKSLSFEGDSGPYLQYALVRAVKILSYASEDADGREIPAEPYPIERLIAHFPEVVARAAGELAPNLLVNYLIELAGEWNAFYATEQVLGSPEEAYKQRVTRAFANTMANGLSFLGIPAPEKM